MIRGYCNSVLKIRSMLEIGSILRVTWTVIKVLKFGGNNFQLIESQAELTLPGSLMSPFKQISMIYVCFLFILNYVRILALLKLYKGRKTEGQTAALSFGSSLGSFLSKRAENQEFSFFHGKQRNNVIQRRIFHQRE